MGKPLQVKEPIVKLYKLEDFKKGKYYTFKNKRYGTVVTVSRYQGKYLGSLFANSLNNRHSRLTMEAINNLKDKGNSWDLVSESWIRPARTYKSDEL